MDFQDKVALITGGSSGLGLATADLLSSLGCKVAIFDLKKPPQDRKFLFFDVDVRNEGDAKLSIEDIIKEWGELHINVNCAGVATGEKTLGKEGPHSIKTFSKTIGINLIGTFNILRLCAAQMAENKTNGEGERGVIINTSSVAAFEGQIGQAAYSASKAAIAGMTLPIARDLSKIGIRVCSIAPGLFRTPLFDGLNPEAIASLETQVPFPSRLGKPSEFALLAKAIIENPMLNGENIRLDGAIRMAPR